MSYTYNTEDSNWQPRPLNRTGNLTGWKARMSAICPNPASGRLVWLDKEYYCRDEQSLISESICYKVLKIATNGEAIWQRGQVVRH
jgi:hypothetical protein